MNTFKDLFEDKVNEGLLQKGMDWLIKNTATFEEMYINTQKNYGAKTFVIESPMDNIKFMKKKNKYVYFSVKYKNKDLLCIMKEDYKTDLEDYISDNEPVALTLAKLTKLENNNITPYFIKKIREV